MGEERRGGLVTALLASALAAGAPLPGPAAIAQEGPAAAAAVEGLAPAYRSYLELLGPARDGAAAEGAAGVTGATGVEAGTVAGVDPTLGGAASVAGTLPGGIAPDRALGQDVHGPGGEDVGEIEDVLVDDGNKVAGVILEVGGLLEVGERRVAVPVGLLRPVADADGGATGGTGEGGGAAGVTGAAGAGAGTGAGAGDVDAPGDPGVGGDRPQLALGMTEEELGRLPAYRREGDRWVRE